LQEAAGEPARRSPDGVEPSRPEWTFHGLQL